MPPNEAERFMKSYLKKISIPVSLIGEITSKRCGYRLIGSEWKEKRISEKRFFTFLMKFISNSVEDTIRIGESSPEN